VSARIQEIPALRCLADVRGWRSGLPRRGEPSTLAARRGGVTDLGSWPSRGGGHGSTLPVLGGWCVLDWRRGHTGFFWGWGRHEFVVHWRYHSAAFVALLS
jgi:hypothetical protein